jgi:WS/DGAT/MGAT family acyltransferase
MVTRIRAQSTAQTTNTAGAGKSGDSTKATKASRTAAKQVMEAVAGTLGLAGERMSRVDTAWLRMDSPSNLMMIVGVWVIRPSIRYADLARRLQDRLLQYPRFLQCAVEDAAGASWVFDPNFDMANHLVREKLPRVAAERQQEALQERLAALCMEPLDRNHPLWQFHLVENYQGGCALMVRIHHCIADGIALIAVTQSLMDGGAPPPVPSRKTDASEDWWVEALLKPLTQLTVKAVDKAGHSAARSISALLEPHKSLESGLGTSVEAAKLAYQVISDLAALALMEDDSPTLLKGQPGRTKRVAWCQPLPLVEVKAVGKALNCSVNDVLLSCVAGAIGQYLEHQGDAVHGKQIRAMVPVNLRPLNQAHRLGNHFGLAPLVLPIGIANPVERVYEVRRRMGGLKGSTQPLLAFGLLAVAGLLIKPAQDAMLNLFSKKTTAVMTNVPGPGVKQKLCGSTIEETLFWVPQSGSVGLGVSILSYGGGVQFGIVSDATLCPQPQQVIDLFEPEFARLAMVTLMLPWGDSDAFA